MSLSLYNTNPAGSFQAGPLSGEIINMAGQRALVYPETPVAPKSIPLEFYAVEVVAKLCSLKNRAGRAFAHLFQSPSHYYSKQFQTLNKLDSESVEEFIDKVHRNLFRQSRADLENICEACVNYFCSGTTNASTRYIRSKLIAAFFQIFSEAASRNDRFSLLILKETFTIIYKEGSLTPQEKRFFEKQINSRSQSINPNTRFHLAKLYFEIRGAHEASVHAYDTREIETESWPHYRKNNDKLKALEDTEKKIDHLTSFFSITEQSLSKLRALHRTTCDYLLKSGHLIPDSARHKLIHLMILSLEEMVPFFHNPLLESLSEPLVHYFKNVSGEIRTPDRQFIKDSLGYYAMNSDPHKRLSAAWIYWAIHR